MGRRLSRTSTRLLASAPRGIDTRAHNSEKDMTDPVL